MTDPSDITTDEEKLSGLLAVVLGGVRVTLPALTLKKGRHWLESLAAKVGPISGLSMVMDPTKPASWRKLPDTIGRAQDVMVDVIAAYDLTGVLGGREAIEDRAYGRELQAVIDAMVSSVLPFDPQAAARGGLAAAPSPEPTSTNGHSPTGDLTLMPSKGASAQDA